MTAFMIPKTAIDCTKENGEEIVYNALRDGLDDGYIVFHSFKFTYVENGKRVDHEIDFLIYHQKKGLICVEAKNGSGIKYSSGQWYYSSGEEMRDPFHQINVSSKSLKKKLNQLIGESLTNKLNITRAVCFQGMSRNRLAGIEKIGEVDPKMILTKDEMENKESLRKYIEDIFAITYVPYSQPGLTDTEHNIILKNFLCPQYRFVPQRSFDIELKERNLNQFLSEQVRIIDFLEEQKFATINGAAGTGKTMIALEKARKHSENGEKVLFLCFNTYLKEYLATEFNNKFIDYKTIAGYACQLTNRKEPDYKEAVKKLISQTDAKSFPYKHVIVDEGQDFGREDIEKSEILEWLKFAVEEVDGSFYIFYDKLQCIQSYKLNDFKLPSIIDNADCRLTLYKNCRNTFDIAKTSLSSIISAKKIKQSVLKEDLGQPPKFYFCTDDKNVMAKVDKLISIYKEKGIKDIAILSCLDVDIKSRTVLPGHLIGSNSISYYKGCRVSTSRKFKGLEAEAVILVDINESLFEGNNKMLFYVAASRAKYELSILTTMTPNECQKAYDKAGIFNQHLGEDDPDQLLAFALSTDFVARDEMPE